MSDDEVGPLLPGAAAGFRRRSIRLEPGESRRSGDAEWRDALVVVEQGDVELECAAGGRRRFAGGAVLWLEGIDLRVLHNVGDGPVVLLAVSRRRTDEPHAPHDGSAGLRPAAEPGTKDDGSAPGF